MDYRGRYNIFDPAQIETYPVKIRSNKVKYTDLIWPDAVLKQADDVTPEAMDGIRKVAAAIMKSRERGRSVGHLFHRRTSGQERHGPIAGRLD